MTTDNDKPQTPETAPGQPVDSSTWLGPKHTGMKVSAAGLIGRIARGERTTKGTRYMLGEFLTHLEQVSKEYYSGNVKIVDQFLQLYALDECRPNAGLCLPQTREKGKDER